MTVKPEDFEIWTPPEPGVKDPHKRSFDLPEWTRQSLKDLDVQLGRLLRIAGMEMDIKPVVGKPSKDRRFPIERIEDARTTTSRSGEAENMIEYTEKDVWRTIIRQFEAWRLTDEQASALIGISSMDWVWIRTGGHDGTLTDEMWQRLDALFRIQAALEVILIAPRCNDWAHRPNKAALFGGQTALDFMIEGGWPAIHDVMLYLQAELHG